MRPLLPLIAVALSALTACHSAGAGGEGVTNVAADPTMGTASDSMTNIDATVGSAANMAADVPVSGNAVASDDSADAGKGKSKQSGSDAADSAE